MTRTIIISEYDSPAGKLILGSLDDKLCLCDWLSRKNRTTIDNRLQQKLKAQFKEGTSFVIKEAKKQLDEYFAHQRTSFNIPLLFAGTAFQVKVWNLLTEIPYGHTVTYLDIAKQMGCPKSVRAVGMANGANAISIFAACHRVIGSNQKLTGYAGGLSAKEYLINLERHAH